MTTTTTGPLALVAHARGVPTSDRERFAGQIAELGAAGFVLKTCHRVEIYSSDPEVIENLARHLPEGAFRLDAEATARHAIAVAVGLDSVVVGEDQILHQLRTAATAASASGIEDPAVGRLINLALRAGRRARSWRSGPTPSLADAALAAAERRTGSLTGRRVLVVGAGEMGSLAVDRAKAAGAIVTVASRSPEHAEMVARRAGVGAASLDPGANVSDLAAIIVAIRGAWRIGEPTAHALLAGSTVVVDLSVPLAVPANLAEALGARFVSVDDLAAEPGLLDQTVDLPRLRTLVDATLAEYRTWLQGREQRATARILVDRAEDERTAELARLWRHLPELDPEARAAIEQMSRHLTSRLLREPLERLGRDLDGGADRAARELFAL